MASYLLATVVLVVFACGVTGVQGVLSDACTDDANCTTGTEACDGTVKKCLLKVDANCTGNEAKCVTNAECDTASGNMCKCKAGFEEDTTRKVCNSASSVIFSATIVMLAAILGLLTSQISPAFTIG